MIALLKLIPGKDIFYVSLLTLVLAIGGGAWVHHDHVEQAKGAAAVAAADARAAATVTAKDKQIAAAEQAALTEIGVTYHAKLALPPVVSTGIVCRNPVTPASSSNTAAADSGPGTDEQTVLPNAGTFDPSGPTLTVLRNADDQVTGLQDAVNSLLAYIAKLRAAAQSNLP